MLSFRIDSRAARRREGLHVDREPLPLLSPAKRSATPPTRSRLEAPSEHARPERHLGWRDVGWIDTELVLVSLAAMLSPTTLTFSVLALVLAERPLRTGFWFFLGAFTATIAVGIAAAFVLGDVAASSTPSSPKTWVAVLDVAIGLLLLAWVVRVMRRPAKPEKTKAAIDQMSKLSSSPADRDRRRGRPAREPGGFIPIALKTISETNPTAAGYAIQWLFFTIMALLPLAVAAHPARRRLRLDEARTRQRQVLARAQRPDGRGRDRRPARAGAAAKRHRRAHVVAAAASSRSRSRSAFGACGPAV